MNKYKYFEIKNQNLLIVTDLLLFAANFVINNLFA